MSIFEAGYYNEEKIEVRYAETDQMGVVYHANYLVWLEQGRTSFIKSLGYHYTEMEAAGVIAPISNVELKYLTPARYGETVTVRTWVTKVTQFRTIYRATVTNESGDLCLESECVTTLVDKDNFQLVSFKKKFPEWYEHYRKIVTTQ